MIIEIVNQETVIDVNGETFTAEVLVTNYSDELIAQYALEAQQAAQEADANATIATNQAIIATNQAMLASAARLNAQNAANAAEASEDAAALSAASALASEQASAISESNASISASNALASEDAADLDAIATAADRVQTGLDRIATGADRVQTGIDANTATVQAGIATTQAGNALTSANNAAVSASTAASAALNTPLTGFASGANTTILSTDTTLQAFGKTQGQISERIGGTVGVGQVAFGTGTKVLGGDNGLFWDNTNKRLGIGTNAPNSVLDIVSLNSLAFITVYAGTAAILSRRANGSVALPTALLNNDLIGGTFVRGHNGSAFTLASNGGVYIYASENWTTGANGTNFGFETTANGGTTRTEKLRIQANGNVLIQNGGTFTDAGFRLDVNGTARVQGNLTTNLTAGSVPFIGASGLLTQDNSNLFWDNTNKRLGIGTVSPPHIFTVSSSIPNTTIGLYNQISNANNRNWAVSSNVISYGDFSISQSNAINGNPISAGTQRLYISLTGNIGINTTTDAGFRLDVNGTARVQGVVTLTSNIILPTVTGTRIGTATNQLLSLWNATPNVQPTTAITAGAFVANTSGIVNDTATFDGYTLGQIVAALRRIGALA